MNLYTTDIPVIDPSRLSYIGKFIMHFDFTCDKRITFHYREIIISETINIDCCKASVDKKSEEY